MQTTSSSASNAARPWSRRTLPIALALCALLALLLAFDGALSERVVAFEAVKSNHVALRDWMYIWRASGKLGTWIVIAIAVALVTRDARRRGPQFALRTPFAAALTLTVIASGLVAELAKLPIRRLRPSADVGVFAMRAWNDKPFDAGGLSMPSSDAAIAFGAAFLLTRVFPAAWPVWMFFALGCGFARVVERQHFPSDICGGALVGLLTAHVVWRFFERRRERAQSAATSP